jgi:hypothetical protein
MGLQSLLKIHHRFALAIYIILLHRREVAHHEYRGTLVDGGPSLPRLRCTIFLKSLPRSDEKNACHLLIDE